MEDIKIVLDNGYLDVDTISGFGINYAIDDIKKIESRNASYTKTVVLPATKNNNTMLGNLFDINSTFTFFNPGAKTNCHILVNSTVVLKGYLQLKNIKKLNQSDNQGNLIQYEVVIYDTTIDLLDRIGEKELTDLDLSSWNHDWNYKSICKTWGINSFGTNYSDLKPANYVQGTEHKWNDAFVYPTYFKGDLKDGNLINDGERDYETLDFYPAIFNKFYIYKIASEAGIEIGGDFWDNVSTFDNEIIPYNREIPQYNEAADVDSQLFKVGLTSKHFHTNLQVPRGTSFVPVYDFDADSSTHLTFNQRYDPIVSDGYYIDPISSASGSIDDRKIIPLDNDSTLTFYDQAEVGAEEGNWENTNYGFSPVSSGYYNVNANIVIALEIELYGDGTQPCRNSLIGSSDIVIELSMNTSIKTTGVTTTNGTKRVLSLTIPRGLEITEDYNESGVLIQKFYRTVQTISGQLLNEFFLNPGDIALLQMRVKTQGFNYVTDYGGANNLQSAQITVDVLTNDPAEPNNYTSLSNSIVSGKLASGKFATIVEGSRIKLNAFIPRGIKQIDLFNDLIKRYNLYVLKDSNNPNKLNLITRDRFYQLGATKELDWTYKIDNDKEQKITLLQELQNKRVKFTYKEDKDDYNKAFTDATSDVYGVKKIEFDNFFAKGEKVIESIFSPTPLVYDSLQYYGPTKIVPAINTRNPSNNVRILQWGGMVDNVKGRDFYYKIWDDVAGAYRFIITRKYPYAGHFDNPYYPTNDISFNIVPSVFYNDLEQITDDCLYNSYWRNYMNQISKGRMLTAQFYLTETDINKVKNDLDSRIFIKDAWYVINKIVDFDPTNTKTTEVELLKMSDPTPFIKTLRINTAPNPDIKVKVPISWTDLEWSGVIPIQEFDPTVGTGIIKATSGVNVYSGGAIVPIGIDTPKTVTDFPVFDGGENETTATINTTTIDVVEGGNNTLRDRYNNYNLVTAFDGGQSTPWLGSTTDTMIEARPKQDVNLLSS